MAILVLPFALIFLWGLFFFIFLAKKSSEGDTTKSARKFWLKFFALGIGCGFLSDLIFDLVYSQNIMPLAIQESIVPRIGFLVGVIAGCVYVLVTHERKN
ncbi:MAG: hypothetical protein ACI8RW_000003 [Porticoccaceae bacterium]|jgi:hypothetical protein